MHAMQTRWLVVITTLLAYASCITGIEAQVLQGEWVDESEAEIDKHRKTDVTVIVLDREDRAVQGATVRLKQTRHDFLIGLTLPTDRLPPEGLRGLPVYRCLNAIALDRLTDWATPSVRSEVSPGEVASAWERAIDPIRVGFGRVVSADPARNTDKLSLLSARDLRDAVLARIDLAADFAPEPDTYDLYGDLLYQDMIERKLGTGMLPRMFDHARARRDDARFGLRVRDVVSLQRTRDLSLAVQKLQIRQIDFDHVAIEQRFTGQVQPRPLGRMLDQALRPLDVPASFAMLEVGGPSDVAAGLNMETFLRIAFAQPGIEGVYLAGLTGDEMIEQHAALIDAQGKPTPAGQALDQLFSKHWRSDERATTDERGNAEARVFTGWYELAATLPDGQVIAGRAYIPKAERSKLIVLQQTAAED
ncbi:MAG: hypothetical protein ACE37H_16775 [Phycisphaeraceae bacterium]